MFKYQMDITTLPAANQHPSLCLKCDGPMWDVISVFEGTAHDTIAYRHRISHQVLQHWIPHWPDALTPNQIYRELLWRTSCLMPNVVTTVGYFEGGKRYSCGMLLNVSSVLVEPIMGLNRLFDLCQNQGELLPFIYQSAL